MFENISISAIYYIAAASHVAHNVQCSEQFLLQIAMYMQFRE